MLHCIQGSELTSPGGRRPVYKAVVEHVADGDTLKARIDLGFRTRTGVMYQAASIKIVTKHKCVMSKSAFLTLET